MITKTKVRYRILAVFLAVALMISTIPISAIPVYADPEPTPSAGGYTISVADSNGKPIEGAGVSYQIFIGSDKYAENNTSTDAEGKATIAEMAGVDMSEPGITVTLHAEISKKGYISAQIENEQVYQINYNLDVMLSSKEDDDTFGFLIPEPVAIKSGDTFPNPAASQKRTGNVIYSIESGDCVSINQNTGEISAIKAGTAVIKAVLAEDDTYKESQATYSITVELAADEGFSFQNPQPTNIIYAPGAVFENQASHGKGTGAVTYAITQGDCATIDTETGKLQINKAGEITVTATRAADASYDAISVSYTLVIEKAAQEALEFKYGSEPGNKLITDGEYNNYIISGGSGNGQLSYSIEQGSEFVQQVKAGSPKLRFIKVGGPITVKAVKAEDACYNEATATYTFNIVKASDNSLIFDKTAPSITYSENLTYTNQLTGGKGSGTVTYAITEGDCATINTETGELQINKAGTVTVEATKAADDKYAEQTAQYTLTVEKADQEGFGFNDGEDINGIFTVNQTWSPDSNTYTNIAEGGSTAGDITYSAEIISNMPYGNELKCASFDVDSATVTMYGKGTITIKAVKAGDDCYNDAEAKYTLNIERADQEELVFADTIVTEITWNDENNNEIPLSTTGGSGDGIVSYEYIKEDNEDPVVMIDGNKVKALKAGMARIKARKAETNTYNSVESEEITITINKADQTIAFSDTTTETIIYGTVYSNPAHEVGNSYAADGRGYAAITDNTKITYEITAGSDIVSAVYDSDNNAGRLRFVNGKIGTFTITAYKKGDDCYNDAEPISYTREVVYAQTPEEQYAISGENNESANEDGWYKTNVKITPANGYKISESNALQDTDDETPDNTWSEYLTVTTEGTENSKTIYLKGTDEGITDGIDIPAEKLKIDKTAPQDLKVSYSESVLDTVLETITFGFYNARMTVTIEAVDPISHVASFEYSYGEGNDRKSGTITAEDIKYSETEDIADTKAKATATFIIEPEFKGSVSFRAKDYAGNTADCVEGKIIIVDTVAPGVTVSFDNNTAQNDNYYKADRTAVITINEDRFFEAAFDEVKNIYTNPETTIAEHLIIKVEKEYNDGTKVTEFYKNNVSDNDSDEVKALTTPFTENNNGEWKASLAFTEEADYTLSINYKDFSGNEADEYSTSFTIDKTRPVIEIEYDDEDNDNDAQNEDHYMKARTATVKVTEHNFDPKDIVVDKMEATDIQGNAVNYKKDYQNLLREGTWTKDENSDTYTIEIPFDVDARYDLKISYADLAGNASEQSVEDNFCIDVTKPNKKNLKVSYNTSILDTILETVTFGFYNAPVEVTIEADDITSGIDYFTYSYTVSEGESSTNEGRSNVVIPSTEIEYSDDGKHAAATFTIPAQFRGNVSFTATDRAGNESDLCKDGKVIVVDTVAPGVTVTYDNNNYTDDNDADGYHYYNENRTATIRIEEANFFKESLDKVENIHIDPAELIEEHLTITVNKVNYDGSEVTEVYKNSSSEQDDQEDGVVIKTLFKPFTKVEEDVWEAQLLFHDNADYSWSIEYKDFSGHEYVDEHGETYKFEDQFTIDKENSVIEISYDNNEFENEDHYKADRIATVTITEHNFRKSDIVVDQMVVTDIQGNAVNYKKDYQNLLREGTWTKDENSDTYTIEIPFDVDARYYFEISYKDMAGNVSKAKAQSFCIDKEAPAKDNLKISYSESVLDTVLETITFGFYKAPVTVTIEADDDISGIDYFKYSYTVSKGESSTNEGKSNVVIPSTEIEYSDNGKHATATFRIPAQFRGNVSFTATDRAGNTSEELKDEKVIVVDKVAPGVNVEYDNNSPVNNSYYKASRTATITIKEANFFTESFEETVDANDASNMIDAHLVIEVTKVDNNGKTETKTIKNKDLTKPFTKVKEDTWEAKLLFAEDADYSWSVVYKDFSGNVAGTYEDEFTVDNTNPVIKVTHSNNTAKNAKYFNMNRPVKIEITEHNFRAQDVNVTVTAKDATGTVKDFSAYLKNPANWTSKGNVHTANILFDTEAHYTFDISYTDMAGRKNSPVDYGSSIAYKSFTIDKTAPKEADIMIDNVSVLAKKGVAFEKFYRNRVEVKYKVNCDISGLDNITYQKVDSIDKYSKDGTWKAFKDSVSVAPNEKFVIYFKAEDKAGNATIVNSTGIVVDDKAPVGEEYAPEIDIKPSSANENGLHNSDVKVDLKILDPRYIEKTEFKNNYNGYYSGINKISYKIYTTDTNASEEGVLYDLESKLDRGRAVLDNDKLVKEWTGSITVSAQKFNSNNVVVEIYAVDNAGNERVTKNDDIGQPIKIDITAPTISVSYENNEGDTTFRDAGTDAFFKSDRAATIVITERNFDPDKVRLTITNTDGVIPALSGWSMSAGSGNGDATTYRATVNFASDGDYTFDISYVDQADNAAGAAAYTGLAPQKFTIDKTLPEIKVTYDNNDVQNGNYYKAQRIATLTLNEHNFEQSRVKITLTATDNGVNSALPAVSGWTSNGDTHVATITYANDSLYSFDFDYVDKAGNSTVDFEKQTFYVDKTSPKVAISQISDESANNDEGNIGFVITATDTNFDVFTPVLTVVVKEGDEFKTKQLDAGVFANINNGKTYTVENLDADGIYRINCTVIDKAGNAYSEVTLSKEDNSTYVENRSGEDTLLTFSVNRMGSTFELDSRTVELLSKYYVQSVKDDVVMVEVNADPLKEYSITLNGRVLSQDEYMVAHEGGEGNWEKYIYTIDKKLFEDEGEYTIVVSSKDKADNDAFSDVKDTSVKFIVDRTAPVVTVTGIEKNGRYQTEKQEVTLVPTDDGGALKSLVVTLVDSRGEQLSEVINLSGEDLTKALEDGNGQIKFEISEGLYQNVRIVCDDEANYEGEENVIYDETITNVSVASSAVLIFWANKPLRWGTIGGGAALIIVIVALIVTKKRKKAAK